MSWAGWESPTYSVLGALAKRNSEDDIALMIDAYRNTKDANQWKHLANILHDSEDPQVLNAFREAIQRKDMGPEYWCLDYLAARGNTDALETLNRDDVYWGLGQPSYQWAETVVHFGTYKYRPAIPNLLNSVRAASLNMGGASSYALRQLYPGPHPEFSGPREAYAYFSELYRREGGNPPPY